MTKIPPKHKKIQNDLLYLLLLLFFYLMEDIFFHFGLWKGDIAPSMVDWETLQKLKTLGGHCKKDGS
jgi:hypothetical protein